MQLEKQSLINFDCKPKIISCQTQRVAVCRSCHFAQPLKHSVKVAWNFKKYYIFEINNQTLTFTYVLGIDATFFSLFLQMNENCDYMINPIKVELLKQPEEKGENHQVPKIESFPASIKNMTNPTEKSKSSKNRPISYIGKTNKTLLVAFVKDSFAKMMSDWNGVDSNDKMIEKIVYGGFCDYATQLGVKGRE